MVNQDLSDTKENNKVVKTQLDAVVRYIHEYYETQDVKEVKNLGFTTTGTTCKPTGTDSCNPKRIEHENCYGTH